MQFTTKSWVEIHRDPGGHYHHWSIVLGTLDSGVLHLGTRVMFRARDGRRLASTVLGGQSGRRTIEFPIGAEQAAGRDLVIALWQPAYRVDVVADEQPIEPCDEPTYRAINRELVAAGWPWCPCNDCCRALDPLRADEPDLWHSVQWLEHPHGYRPPT